MRPAMKKKIVEKFIFEGFGFSVILHNVIVDKYDGEEFPEINYAELKLQTVRALIMSSKALNGAQLQFLRKYTKKSLRDLGEDLEVSHAQIKIWEDKSLEFTGMTQNQERKLKNHVLNYLISQEQRFLYDRLLTQEIVHISDDGPFDPYKEELKYG